MKINLNHEQLINLLTVLKMRKIELEKTIQFYEGKDDRIDDYNYYKEEFKTISELYDIFDKFPMF